MPLRRLGYRLGALWRVWLLQTRCGPAGNRSFELQDEPFLSNSPAAVRVSEADRVGALLVHLLPVLSSINRVVGSGWSNREHGGTGRARHNRDTPAVSRRTVAALFPSLAAVVTVGGIWLHHLRMIIVSADDHQSVGIHDGDREDALVQAGDERRLGGGPRLARIGSVEDAGGVFGHEPRLPVLHSPFLFSISCDAG